MQASRVYSYVARVVATKSKPCHHWQQWRHALIVDFRLEPLYRKQKPRAFTFVPVPLKRKVERKHYIYDMRFKTAS